MRPTDVLNAWDDATSRQPVLRYGMAVALVALAVALRIALDPVLGTERLAYITLFAALMFTSWLGGLGPGLLALVVGGAGLLYLILPPRLVLALETPVLGISLALYLVIGGLCVLFGNAVRRAQQRAEKNAQMMQQESERLRREVNERRQTQEELRKTNEQLRQVLEELEATYSQSPVGMLQLDRNLGYVRVNEAMAAINGIPIAEHFGKTVHDIVPELAQEIEAVCRRVIETGRPVINHELSGETKADPGVVHTWLESWFPLRDAGGEVVGLNVVAQDITERKQAEEAQRRLNETLEERVAERTVALVESERRARLLASMLTMAEQEERRRISQVLHDDLQQQLYAIQLKLHAAQEELRVGDAPNALDNATEAEHWIQQSIETTRRLTVDLSPPILRSEGLADALRWLVTQMKEMHGLEVQLVASHAFRMPDEDMRVLLFQIVREMLFNVVKHAGIDRARVELDTAGEEIVILISDEGAGFDVAQAMARVEKEHGFGLFNAAERLRLFGGDMEIESAPGRGTRFTIHVATRVEEPSRL